jgi:hypothetical protein
MEAYRKFMWAGTVVVILLILAMLVYFFFIKEDGTGSGEEVIGKRPAPRRERPVTPPPVQQPGPEPAPDMEPALGFSLRDSDEPVRELAKECTGHPEFGRWLKFKGLIRRFVAVTDNISNGVSPVAHLEFLEPRGPFTVEKKEDMIVLDSRSFIRYQPVTMALVSLRTEEAVKLYRRLLPVLEEAYRELGYPGQQFGETLSQAFDVLLNTPAADGDILLVEKVTTYGFADPNLERLNDAQKHLLRMGPENARKIKAKIRDIKAALKAEGLL